MGTSFMEILLLIVSACVFVVSFVLPEKKPVGSGMDQELAKEEIKNLVAQQLEETKAHVEGLVDESMTYAMEKTERSLERLSNEKIMAVSEYSDTVLSEIHKNHEEVMFLYDMLNNKHDLLKKTVVEASKAAKAMQDSVESFQTFRPVEVAYGEHAVTIAPLASKVRSTDGDEKGTGISDADAMEGKKTDEPTEPRTSVSGEPMEAGGEKELVPDVELITPMPLSTEDIRNSNEKILELHRQGKSNVAIAKELGLGVGEVKLVIELFKNL